MVVIHTGSCRVGDLPGIILAVLRFGRIDAAGFPESVDAGRRSDPAGASGSALRRPAARIGQAQADTTGFLVLPRWTEILERHFPPELSGPDHAIE